MRGCASASRPMPRPDGVRGRTYNLPLTWRKVQSLAPGERPIPAWRRRPAWRASRHEDEAFCNGYSRYIVCRSACGRTHVDQRMPYVVAQTQVSLTEQEIQALNRNDLDHLITELRRGETAVRHLRKRLEALLGQVQRSCPVCGAAVSGRPDAVYCGSRCRLRAHPGAKGSTSAAGRVTD